MVGKKRRGEATAVFKSYYVMPLSTQRLGVSDANIHSELCLVGSTNLN